MANISWHVNLGCNPNFNYGRIDFGLFEQPVYGLGWVRSDVRCGKWTRLLFCTPVLCPGDPSIQRCSHGSGTAAYGIGAAIAPLPFELLLDGYGFRGGMIGLAFALASTGSWFAYIFSRSGHYLLMETNSRSVYDKFSQRVVTRLWIAYGTAVAVGLMVIGHASQIAHLGGLSEERIFIAPIAIVMGNVVGSYFVVYLADVWGARRLLHMVSVYPLCLFLSCGAIYPP